MKHRCVRLSTLWRVPVYVLAANYLCSVLILCGAVSFYTVRYTGADGAVSLYVDPIRRAIFSGGLSLAVLLLGGLLFFRHMTKREIALSVVLLDGIKLAISVVSNLWLVPLLEIPFPGPFQNLGLSLLAFMELDGTLASILSQFTQSLIPYYALSALIPLLFVLFGRGEGGKADTQFEQKGAVPQ